MVMIVAEIGANHCGNYERARELVKAAAYVGADAVKFQTFTPEEMVGDPDYVIKGGPWGGMKLIDLYRKAWTPWVWHESLFDLAKELGMTPFSTPFSEQAVEFLESLECPIYKIASFEITDLDLVRRVAKCKKPIFMSTGMAQYSEILAAHQAIREAAFEDTLISEGYQPNVTLFQCTSAYPAPYEAANLATLKSLKEVTGRVGLSDHSLGAVVPAAAVAMGAEVIEKHLTLVTRGDSPDAGFSMDPGQFEEMVEACRNAEKVIGRAQYGPHATEVDSVSLRRSLYFAKDMRAGDTITEKDLRAARPALGMSPLHKQSLIGKIVHKNVHKNQPVTWEAMGYEHFVE